MKLIGIKTQNFKKLRRFEAEFTPGLNVIVGDNAQGKSTLLQAIECALYGAAVVPGKKDKIPTWGQSSWKVELTFHAGGDDYALARSKSTSRLVRHSPDAGEELVANGNTPVTQFVAELLDLNAKDYNLFMQSKQGETSGVLTFGAAALNRKVEEFAGISLIDQVQSLAQEEYRTYKAEADAKSVPQERIDSQQALVGDLADTLDGAEHALGDAQEALDQMADPDSLEKPDGDPDALQGRLSAIRRLQGQVERARAEVDNAKRRYDEALHRFEELEKPEPTEDLEQRVAELQRQVRPSVSRVNELQSELANLQQLFNQLYEAEVEFDRHEPEDDIGNALAHEAEQQVARHESLRVENEKVVELNQQIKQLQSLRKDANCPTCGTRLSEHDPEQLAAEIEQLAAERDKHERARGDLQRTCKAIDEQVSQLQRGLERAQAAEAKVDRLREELVAKGVVLHTGDNPVEGKLAEAKEVHEGLLTEVAQVEHRLEQSEGEWGRYRRAERAMKTEYRHLSEAQEQRDELEGQLAAGEAEGVPTDEQIQELREAWSKYHAEKGDLHQKRQEARHAVDMAQQGRNQAKERLQHAEKVLGDLRDANGKAYEASVAADKAGRLARFLRERRAGYLQEVWDAVLAAASRQVSMASKGMISRLVYDDGDFLFEEEGVLAPVASASGAQKAHIGVAIRIGLSRALYGSDALIIFDEPTESMSEHHASGLSASLAGAASQCLLITHREQDQDLAANVIEVAS